MKSKKVVIESVAVVCMAGLLSITAATGAQTNAEQSEAGADGTMIAGVASVLNGYELDMADETDSWLSVINQSIETVAASYEDDTDDDETGEEAEVSEDTEQEEVSEEPSEAEETVEEVQLTEEEQEWLNYLMANVDEEEEYVYVREAANDDSEAVGKLYKGDVAEIVGTEGEWTQVTSGNVAGYVKTEDCVTGLDALSYMKENCGMIATVTTSKKLRVRKEPSTSSKIIKNVTKGDVLTVDMDTETSESWVAVIVNSTTCYVCADYVELSYNIGTGITIEEEEAAAKAAAEAEAAAKKAAEEKAAAEAAAQEAAEKEAAEKEAAEKAASESSDSSSSDSYDADTDEVKLLAALIQCEAGGESYECQLAVGAVVMNRVASSRFPNTIEGVIYQSGQFTPASSGSLARRLKGTISSTAYKAAEAALAGTDNTDGCLYFNDIYHTSRTGLTIGKMIFWKSW